MTEWPSFSKKMQNAGLGDEAIAAFHRSYRLLTEGAKGLIAEEEIEPASGLPGITPSIESEWDQNLLAKTVVIKLNGGLGTGMGLQKAKSLLPVKDGKSFLDLIVHQIEHLRSTSQATVRFLLMNSFSTSEDTLAVIKDGPLAGEDVEFLQNKVPKIDANSLKPASWPSNPADEWCPPGHGDLYPALLGSGQLDRLLAEGIRYAFVSNSDNLGATLDADLLKWFAESGAPFAMEVTRRTEADKKGGHLARRKSDDRLILREIAQCSEADIDSFQDISRHQYFNTNNLWFDLEALKQTLDSEKGVLPLPVIQNSKTVDPRDSSSPAVWQLETAMGSAIECFEGAQAISVPRSRFAPVKTTADLLALRSDAYQCLPDGRVTLVPERKGKPPLIQLSKDYKLVDALDQLGATPSLVDAESLSISGKVSFSKEVKVIGKAIFENAGEVLPGTYGESH